MTVLSRLIELEKEVKKIEGRGIDVRNPTQYFADLIVFSQIRQRKEQIKKVYGIEEEDDSFIL